jgi:hypothetical protein
MSDLLTATQTAVYNALNVSSVTDLAPVTQHVIEDTEPPLVIIGDVSFEPIGGKSGGLDRATVEIVTLYRGPKRTELFAIQTAVRNALDGQGITASGALLSDPVFVSSDVEELEDGVTYMGTQRFETIVQPA